VALLSLHDSGLVLIRLAERMPLPPPWCD